MSGEQIELAAPDGACDAYLTGAGGEPRPGVLLLMDAYGLRPVVQELADRIAADGYVVLAPNLFYRAGTSPVPPPPPAGDDAARAAAWAVIRPVMAQLTPERIAADGSAYLDALAAVAAPGPSALTGYCMGGRVGWWIAAAHPDRVAALAGFHVGGLVSDDPASPHRAADRLRAEVYLGFADADASMPAEAILALAKALEAAGVRHRCEVYEGAAHGYTMADTPAFDAAARERHFAALHALLGRALA